MNKQLPITYLVVTLLGLSVFGESVPADTTLEVDRPTRNDWIGSKLARDATDAEIEAYRSEEGAGEDDSYLVGDRAELIKEIKALTADHTALEVKRVELLASLDDLVERFNALTAEVAELEAAKAAAAKAPAAKK